MEIETSRRVVRLISAGASHTTALLSGDIVCSWGRGEDGQLGHGAADDRHFPTIVSSLQDRKISSVTCGADHTTARSDTELKVYSWGWGDFGRLGHGNSSDLFIPQPIKELQGIKIHQIVCGDSHCLAITMDGEVRSWGRNQNGQLGLGNTEDSLVPRTIDAFQRIFQVACGWRHTIAITKRLNVFSWGRGTNGQLGHGDTLDRNLPKLVEVLSADGQACAGIDNCKSLASSAAVNWISPSERYAVVPDETVRHLHQEQQNLEFSN